mgnify:CR=1 FL=1
MTGHPRQAATAQLLVGAAIIGTNGLMVRLAEMAPTAVAFWRMLLAGLMLGALVLARHGWQPLSRKAWLWCLLPALAFAIDRWMWHRSILLVGPGLATLLANAQVFFMALAGLLGRGALGWDGLLADARRAGVQARLEEVRAPSLATGILSGATNMGDVA